MDKNRLCLVIPSLKAGGMERVMSDLANYFSHKEYIEIHLICLTNGERFFKINNKVIIHEPTFLFNPVNRKIDQIRTIDKQRVIRLLGELSKPEIKETKSVIKETYVD